MHIISSVPTAYAFHVIQMKEGSTLNKNTFSFNIALFCGAQGCASLFPGRHIIDGCSLLRVCVHGVSVCVFVHYSLLCVCTWMG